MKLSINNTSGYNGIGKHGDGWRFTLYIDGKNTHIKFMHNLEALKEYATQWKIDNGYQSI